MDFVVPDGVTRLFLVRHGETEGTSRGLIAGRLDIALSDLGREQARAVGARLLPASLVAVYSSTSRRALDSARAIAKPHGLTPIADPDLCEIDFGVLEGLTFAEVETRHPEIAAAWLSRPHEIEFPGGESLAALRQRVERSTAGIVGRHPFAAIAVVCHAGPIRALVAHSAGLSSKQLFELACPYGSVTVLDIRAETTVRANRK